MSITIVVTAGSASANSYATVAEIGTYAESTVWNSSWTAKSADEKKALAVRAARALDVLSFAGVMTDDQTQARQWPRSNVTSPSGTEYSTTAIPAQIKDAQAHIAAYLSSLASTSDPFAVDDTSKIQSLGVGPISLTFRQSVGPDGGTFLYTVIAPMLRPWGYLASVGSVRLTR